MRTASARGLEHLSVSSRDARYGFRSQCRFTAGGNCWEEHRNHIRVALGLPIVHWEREEDAWKSVELPAKLPHKK